MYLGKTIFRITLLAAFISLTLTYPVSAQDVQKITLRNKEQGITEVFSVLKENPGLRQGKYEKRFGPLKTTGFYVNNKRVGLWQCFNENEELLQSIDFSTNTVIVNPIVTPFRCFMAEGSTYREITPEQAPAFIDGPYAIGRLISLSIQYPALARENQTQGEVLISVVITTDGRITRAKIESSLGYGTDEEALRAIQQLPDLWLPGIVNGQPTELKILIPVRFRLI